MPSELCRGSPSSAGMCALERIAHAVGQVAAHHTRAVGQSIGMPARFRIEQQPRGFAGAPRHDDGFTAHLLFGARGLVDIRNGGHLAGVVRDQLARHGVREQLDAPGLHRWEYLHLAGRIIGRRNAAAPALRAVVAGRPAIGGLGDHGEARWNAGNVQFRAGALHQHLVNARRRAGLEDAVGRAANAFLAARYSDEALGFVVIRTDFVVSDGPIRA